MLLQNVYVSVNLWYLRTVLKLCHNKVIHVEIKYFNLYIISFYFFLDFKQTRKETAVMKFHLVKKNKYKSSIQFFWSACRNVIDIKFWVFISSVVTLFTPMYIFNESKWYIDPIIILSKNNEKAYRSPDPTNRLNRKSSIQIFTSACRHVVILQ